MSKALSLKTAILVAQALSTYLNVESFTTTFDYTNRRIGAAKSFDHGGSYITITTGNTLFQDQVPFHHSDSCFSRLSSSTHSSDKKEKNLNNDLNRLKYALDQVKTDVVEAELRASAAEKRVRLLKQETEKIESTRKQQDHLRDQNIELEKKVSSLTDALDQLKLESQKQAMDSETEISEMKSKLAAETEQLKLESQKQATDFKTEISEMKSKVAAETAKKSKEDQLPYQKQVKNLESKVIAGTMEFVSEKSRLTKEKEKIVGEKDAIISEKDVLISNYEEERSSVRRLLKQSLQLVKSRTMNVLKRNKGKS